MESCVVISNDKIRLGRTGHMSGIDQYDEFAVHFHHVVSKVSFVIVYCAEITGSLTSQLSFPDP